MTAGKVKIEAESVIEKTAAVATAEASVKRQAALSKRLEKEQGDHEVMHKAFDESEKALLEKAAALKIIMRPSGTRRVVSNFFSEVVTTPAKIVGSRENADAEFNRLWSTYRQKFFAHRNSEFRLVSIENQLNQAQGRAARAFKIAEKVSGRQAEALAARAERDAERAQLETEKLKREQPGYLEARRILRTRKLVAKTAQIKAREALAAAKKERRLRREAVRIAAAERRIAGRSRVRRRREARRGPVNVRAHKRGLRTGGFTFHRTARRRRRRKR